MCNIPPLVAIVGETASGKTALAIAIAKRFNGEIICADSWTVYRGFDIGTAKPTPAEQQSIPHYMLDIADPREGFSAAKFKRLAQEYIVNITSKQRLPILVGGSGLYVDSVLFDYDFLPPADPGLRAALNTLSLSELQERANGMGLDMTGIDMQNKRRVIRLIENDGVRPTRHALRPNTLVLGMQRPLDELKERIRMRVDVMVEQGFVEEVRALGELYGWGVEAMRAPGYRAFAAYVRGEISLADAKAQFVQNDIHLAKKQRTWFKRNESIQWISEKSNYVDIVTTFLNKSA